MADREEAVQRLMGLADKLADETAAFATMPGWASMESADRADDACLTARSTLESALREVLMPAGESKQPLGDALAGPGHTLQPPSSASAAVPIAKDTSQAVRVLRLALQAAREFIVSESEDQYGPASQVDREQAISEVTHVLRITEP